MNNKILDNYLFEAFANASDNIFIYVTDVQSGLSRWSKSAVDFFDLEGEYFYDAATKWLEHVHPDDRQIYLDDIGSVMNGEKMHHNCQYRAMNRYGEYVWVECRGSMIVDDHGIPKVFAGIMTWLDNQNKYDNLTHQLTGFELLRGSYDKAGSLMIIGVDRLRDINSQHGLLYGNKVIIRLSDLLNKYGADTDIYRFQGDEFAVYGKGFSPKKMKAIYDKICKAARESENECGLINFNVSAGISSFKAKEDIADVLARVELSLSFAKEKSPCAMVYSSEIEEMRTRRNLVSEALVHSIKNKFEGFFLVYQPILSNTGDTVVGCEALLRWKPNNEAIGNCYPDEFIAILEENGGINEVGYFVMREAIKQAAKWQRYYKKFNVSFNVSYIQLEDPKFVPAIIETVEKYKLDPEYVIVELTESVLAADTIMVKNSFELLKQHGVKIALDDFGTGNSSFWMLHNIEVDIIKLDQSFIRGLDNSGKGIDYAIVESVGIMCNRIGCMTVAEGVETDTIWKMISKFEFTGLQGYLFSRPVEVPEFEKVLVKYGMKLSEEERKSLINVSYEKLVGEAKKAVKNVDSAKINNHLAIEFDIEGKGEGAFYVEFTDESIEVEPYEYYDHDFRIRCSFDVATRILKGKLSPVAAVAEGAAIIEGDTDKLIQLEDYLKAEPKPKKKRSTASK